MFTDDNRNLPVQDRKLKSKKRKIEQGNIDFATRKISSIMPARRRFHGYCPPMARKISNMVVVSSKDDYTTTLNSLAVNRAAPKDMVLTIPAVFSRMEATRTNLDKGNSNCFPLRQDLDEDNFFDDGDIMSTQLSPVYRTRSQNQSSNDGFVTSLSQDSRDEIQAFTCRQNIIEARQISKVELNLDKMASYQHEEGNEIDAIYRTVPISQLSETSSVEESLFVETFDTLVAKGDVPKKPTEAEFWSFRLNYLIVICAIMLADGLQGTDYLNFAVSKSRYKNCDQFPQLSFLPSQTRNSSLRPI